MKYLNNTKKKMPKIINFLKRSNYLFANHKIFSLSKNIENGQGSKPFGNYTFSNFYGPKIFQSRIIKLRIDISSMV